MADDFTADMPQWQHTPEPSPLQPLVQSRSAMEKWEKRRAVAKPVAYIIGSLVLICIIVVVYAVSNEGSGSGVHISNHRWQQMESTHAFASSVVPQKWIERDACASDTQFTLTMALKQSNTENLHDEVMKVSDPESESFRKFWTPEEVRAYFAPDQDTIDTVYEWLETNGFSIANGRLSRGQYGSTVRVSVSCAEANALLNTQYVFYEQAETQRWHLRVKDGTYNVPESIFEHIDFIEPTIRFPLRKMTKSIRKIDIADIPNELKNDDPTISQVKNMEEMNAGSHVTPDSLYSLYGIDSSVVTQLQSSSIGQSVASFNEDYYDDDDLETAWESLGYISGNDISQMTRDPDHTSSGYNDEAELDTQYITATGAGLDTTVFYIDDDEDPFTSLAEAVMDSDNQPSVVSISYGADEYELGSRYCERADQEFGKLALIGTTVLASSGDSGTLGNDADCYQGEEFIVAFPASATYVTAVGGTEGGSSGGSSTGETAWYYSGGGFSSYFSAPSWQTSATTSYFDASVDFPDTDRYSSNMRGLPDISAQSVDYIIVVKGEYYAVSGTSASCPVVAGMVAMINAGRAENGQSSLGFLNPTLYSLYDSQRDNEYFNDVTEGHNEGCSVDNEIGWYAASGWDPVTGVGTPKFDALFGALSSNGNHHKK